MSFFEPISGADFGEKLEQARKTAGALIFDLRSEEDYELGRQKLLRNLMLQALPWPFPLLTSLGTSHHPPLELTYCSGVCSLPFQPITPLPFFFFKGKDKNGSGVPHPSLHPCAWLPFVPLFHLPPHVCLYSHLATEP